MSATCTKCYGTGVRRHPFYTDGKPCDCGWQPGGPLRAAAFAEAVAEAEARTTARLARRQTRINERSNT